jgi:NADH:ubiquinone oxidoreductase subunit 2 (subunit N)
MVLVSANSLVTMYLGVELLALSLYALVAFNRDSGIAAEAAIKYFVLGSIASGALLYGMSIIYGVTGSLELGVVSNAASADGGGTRSACCSAWRSSWSAYRVQVRRGAFPYMGARRLSRRAYAR